jgi:hypothetical protein
MSVISTDVELSATEIAELHQDIANGFMDPPNFHINSNAVLTSIFQRFADSDDNSETYLQDYFGSMRANQPNVE